MPQILQKIGHSTMMQSSPEVSFIALELQNSAQRHFFFCVHLSRADVTTVAVFTPDPKTI